MKKSNFLLPCALLVLACASPEKQDTVASVPEASTIELPYTASYTSNTNQDVSDEDLQLVLQSYKDWETGNMEGLRSAFGDSVRFTGWDGTIYNGPTEGLLSRWTTSRDSLSSVEIDIAVWLKSHVIEDGSDYIVLWYKEIDTYKNGKVDSADWHDINQMVDGKIAWYSQYRRKFKVQ